MSPAGPRLSRQVLVTGASGFVGRRLAPLLEALGWSVRCLTRDAAGAARQWPHRTWIQGDVSHADDLERALAGCQAAYYLVHSLAEHNSALVERERALAETFALAAERADLERVVYLGATAPQGPPSDHLRGRLEAGRVLRSGRVPALELRAGMIVGYGSASWGIVRDLAARLPAMVLPRWLRTRSQPVAIDDVIVALASGLRLPLTASQSYDLPGPEVMTYRETLVRTRTARPHASGRRRRSAAESNAVFTVDPPGHTRGLVRSARAGRRAHARPPGTQRRLLAVDRAASAVAV
jgi:uncharacterized protein YbjT (DUF2867 family)